LISDFSILQEYIIYGVNAELPWICDHETCYCSYDNIL